MNRTTLIIDFDYQRTLVSEELLKDALELYESGLDRVVRSQGKEDENRRIPGMEDFNLCDGIIETYYRQNPGFDYRDVRSGFTPEQLKTLENIQNDKQTREYLRKKEERKRYR